MKEAGGEVSVADSFRAREPGIVKSPTSPPLGFLVEGEVLRTVAELILISDQQVLTTKAWL